MMEHIRSSKALRVMLAVMICVGDVAWAAAAIYRFRAAGTLLRVRDASQDPLRILGQHLVTAAFPILLLLAAACLLKQRFPDELGLRVRAGRQRTIVCALAGAAAVLLAAALAVKPDRIMVLYSFVYYLFFVAFCEEFVVRGVCAALLRPLAPVRRYLLPNTLFALMHLFSYAGWTALTPAYVLQFLTGDVLGLVAVGCLFQLLREKSGTLWTPILLHAMLDFSVVFGF